LLAEDPDTGQTTLKPEWLRGPFGPVQVLVRQILLQILAQKHYESTTL